MAINLIVKMIHGSHLYGTQTENSDKDFCGVYMPSKEEILLNRVPKSINKNIKNSDSLKNTKDDIDYEIYSLHYFIELACQGQTKCLDMLFAPENMIIRKSPIWDSIVANRDKFLTKNLKAFVGYARRQANRYGLRGGRVNTVNEVIKVLESAS